MTSAAMPIGFAIIELELTEATVVAAPERAIVIDRPMSISPLDGSAYVPSSGLLGGLRQHARNTGVDSERLFGPEVLQDGSPAIASAVRALGSVTTLDGVPVTAASLELRERTAIDPARGAAAAKTLHSMSMLPPGTRVALYLEVRQPRPVDLPVAEGVAALAALAATWKPLIGGGSSTGLGRARVVAVRSGIADPTDPDQLVQLCALGGCDLVEHFATDPTTPVADDRDPWRNYEFDVVTPLLVSPTADHDDNDNDDGQHANVVVGLRRGDEYVIDGSSLKGVIRHRVEFILRTLAVLRDELTNDDVERALVEMFGSTSKRGALAFRGATFADSQTDKRLHVAIDRVTGGARDTLLFGDRPVTGGNFRLDIDAAPDAPTWMGDLIDAAVIDIDDGLVGFGAATSRGYGTVSCRSRPSVDLAGTIDRLCPERPTQQEAS